MRVSDSQGCDAGVRVDLICPGQTRFVAVTVGKLSLLRPGLRSLDLLSPEPGGGNPWVTPFNALVSASASPARV